MRVSKAYDISESFLSKVTFESKENFQMWRRPIHTCASFYLRKSTFRNRTSSIPESFLSQMVSCDWPESQHSSVHETPLFTGNFRCSTCKCHVKLSQVTCASFLAKVSCASDFRKKLSDVS